MAEERYMISDVSKMLNIQASVLRYFEYHLSLNIKRTELGHRYYTQEDIDLLSSVKALRDKGFDLKMIKAVLPYIDKVRNMDESKMKDMKERMEIALGLCGNEARENLRSQYGKVIEINMDGKEKMMNPAQGVLERPQNSVLNTESEKSNKKITNTQPVKEKEIVVNAKDIHPIRIKPNEVISNSSRESKTDEVKQENVITYKNLNNNDTNAKEIVKEQEIKVSNQNPDDIRTSITQVKQQSNEITKLSEEKVEQFKKLMTSIVSSAIKQNNQNLAQEINDAVTDSVVREMDYMLSLREAREEQKAEERFRQLDRILRETVNNRQQAAATKENRRKRESKFFKKNKVRI